ncbi:hypothetical protein [Falsiroseomonas sp.]|uniref:hypothetical protein n=1 Tax=Falsiroseomonas sp. TaxID=2870721 RepID=UPI003F7164EB
MNAFTRTIPQRRHFVRLTYRPVLLQLHSHPAERVCIGVVAREGDRPWVYCEANKVERLKAFFGAASERTFRAIELTKHDVQNQLSSGRLWHAERIKMPLSGFSLGEEQEAAGTDLESALDNALAVSSSLHVGRHQRLTDQARDAANFELLPVSQKTKAGRLHNEVKNEVRDRSPGLVHYFGRVIYQSAATLPPRIGFLNQRLVANFISIGQRTNPSDALQRAQAGLHVLSLSRKSPEAPTTAQQRMFLRVPVFWEGGHSRPYPELEPALEEIQFEANKLDIHAEWQGSSSLIASRVIETAS